MSRPALALPIRALSKPQSLAPQWTCRRCLATQAESKTSRTTPPSQNAIPSVSPPPADPAAYDPTLPASQRIGPDGSPYRLKRSDFLLKKPLTAHAIPVAYLQHSTSSLLPASEQAQRAQTAPHKPIVGVVVSAGKMDKTVRVRVGGQTWNQRIGKMFHSHEHHLVHDPNNSLVAGDVVQLHRLRVSRRVAHVVAAIVAPFGAPVDARAPIPSPDERLAAYKEKRFAKLRRRELRQLAADGDSAAITALKTLGLDPGAGAEPGVGRKENVQSQSKGRDLGRGPLLGDKGQKLPSGVLPGGKHAVGKINERAMRNKEVVMKREAKTEENLLEAKEKGEELEKKNLGAGSGPL